MNRPLAKSTNEGFALLGVLWALIGIATLALVARVAARDVALAAGNRRDLEVAAWRAEGCLAQVRSEISSAMKEGSRGGSGVPWADLDSLISHRDGTLTGAGCELKVHAPGAAVDVNRADPEMLWKLLRGLGATPSSADSLVDALLDWRDPDSTPRALGAEATWYRLAQRPAPRNAPFSDARELARVRGYERLRGLDTLVTVESLKIPLNRAPLGVLAALPGMGSEVVARVAEMRVRREPLYDLAQLQPRVSNTARLELMRHNGYLVSRVTAEPDVWEVTVRASAGVPRVTSVLEVRLGRTGNRVAVLRRRTWLE